MDYEKCMFNIEQKKAYDSFTKEALIEIVMRKNRQLEEWARQKLDASTDASINNEALLGVVPDKLKNRIDLAYLTGVFNVVGIDGLHKEIKRLKAIDKKPSDFIV